ncbi:HAD family hydrolase [Mycolicibacterium sp. 120266]|uniref:HAD family hydrolase n=1 Tax=Mycolicibacterium sp. 120266 TaxID=3090601 RepID=UPI00299D56C0|nr:HAD family hydrolase [Mycolicibacterium sp. 120266]MDX1875188.1 HAD family hydrolase [Mycolicibacterium sp. 120266]
MGSGFVSQIRCVVFDVGETLVDETRMWTGLAQQVGVTPFALSAVVGALIAAGKDHHHAWEILGVERPASGLDPTLGQLYPDALECVSTARGLGMIVGVAGNQPAGIDQMLCSAGLEVDFLASSAGWGVAKPDPAFFARLISEAGVPGECILYVGDRLDNDVLPARAAGMRTAFVRRGPWGYLHSLQDAAALADVRVDSLSDLSIVMRTQRGTGI